MLPSLRRAPASRHRGAAPLIGGVGSREQICGSGVFDLKPSQQRFGGGGGGVGADYRLLCFSNSFFPFFLPFLLFRPLKNSPRAAFFSLPSLRSRHSSVGGTRNKSDRARWGWWERRAESPAAVMTHYGGCIIIVGAFCSRPLAAPSPSGPAAFILPRRDCN